MCGNKRSFLLAALLCTLHAGAARALSLADLRSRSRIMAIDNGTRLRFSTATIDGLLNEGQKICILDAKPIIRSIQFELAVGTTYYALPGDYLQMRRLTLKFLELQEITPEAIANKAGLSWETSQALPTNYFINFASRTNVGFYPVPGSSSSTGTVRLEYYAQETDLVASSDVPFNGIVEMQPYHDLLAYYAAYRMAAIDGRSDLAGLYRTEFYTGLERMKREALNRPSYRPGLSPSMGTTRVGP